VPKGYSGRLLEGSGHTEELGQFFVKLVPRMRNPAEGQKVRGEQLATGIDGSRGRRLQEFLLAAIGSELLAPAGVMVNKP